jgi:autophagy-related protein 2
MITMNPREKISSDKHLMSDEAQAVLEMLPMRCFLHQSTLKFMKEFFSYSDSTIDESPQLNIEPPPPTFFQLFKVKPVKLKIDYIPDRIDTAALKNGSLIELLNLLPIEDMILRLNPLEIHNSSGWSSIVTEIINRWLENITTNQMHKFITRTSPLQPISSVGEGVKELIMLPLEEYRQGGDVSSGLRKGASDLVGIVAYETAKVTGRLTKLAATTLDRTTKENSNETLWSEGNGVNNSGLTAQALEKLTRGIERANTKVIMIPYREYQRCGPKGAMKSVIKGLPVAICAPLSGAAQALSLGLQGLCDHIRPDQKNETEAYTD